MIKYITASGVLQCVIKVKGLKLRSYSMQHHINYLLMAPPIVYHTFDSVLAVLNDEKFKDKPAVKSLMEIYNGVRNRNVNTSPGDQKRHPLIVMEGLDGSGKTTISNRVAKEINAEFFCTPPHCLDSIRGLFEEDALLRTAYYAMGNYIAAMELVEKLKEKPVILDRFWHSTTAFAIAQAINNNPSENKLPPVNNEIYRWPIDLLKPDLVILLTVSEEVRVQRHSLRNTTHTTQEKLLQSSSDFRQNVLSAYNNMVEPSVEIMNGDSSKIAVTNAVLEKIKHLFR